MDIERVKIKKVLYKKHLKCRRCSDFTSFDVHTLDHVTEAMEYEFRKRVRKGRKENQEEKEREENHAAAAEDDR